MTRPALSCDPAPDAGQAPARAPGSPLYREYIAAMALELARMARSGGAADEHLADLLDQVARAAIKPRTRRISARQGRPGGAGPDLRG